MLSLVDLRTKKYNYIYYEIGMNGGYIFFFYKFKANFPQILLQYQLNFHTFMWDAVRR